VDKVLVYEMCGLGPTANSLGGTSMKPPCSPGPWIRSRLARFLLPISLTIFGTYQVALGAGDRVFSIPVDSLKLWSERITVPLDVRITGHSGVHALDQDCEMHFGGISDSFKGDPPGIVLEPMNLCVQPFFGKTQFIKKDWLAYADGLVGTTVHAEGVPRIWPEHLVGDESDSNPHHALELHPLTTLRKASLKRDFSAFIFDPSEYEGGLKPETAMRILTRTTVSVANHDGMAEITFDSGRIGNFTFLHFTILSTSIETLEGGHRMDGEVQGEAGETIPVRLVTVAGSPADRAVAKLTSRSGQRFGMDALVLLSLSPEALHKAARESNGDSIVAQNPFQLIVYGEAD
jgi:hypothetical protein